MSPGSDWVEIAASANTSSSYLGDFLFPPRRAKSPIRMLSGGERNRLLLARLFARPANVLVLDEPTNDLDIDSLELLENLLQDYAGTLLLVSHDRAFLDNVVTQTIAAEGGGRWREYVGGYSDWLRQRTQALSVAAARICACCRECGFRRAQAQAQLQGTARARVVAGKYREARAASSTRSMNGCARRTTIAPAPSRCAVTASARSNSRH